MSDEHDQFAWLMQQVQDGSEDAARQVVEVYGPAILHTVRRQLHHRMRTRFDSQDFLQAIWASVFANREAITRFDRPERLIGFLARMARNKVIDEHRLQLTTEKRNLRREVSLDGAAKVLGDQATAATPTPSQEVVAKEQWERLTRDLPDDLRRMVERRVEGATSAEIAAELGMNERTVRRLLQKLAARLERP